jgi:hypothetical protein
LVDDCGGRRGVGWNHAPEETPHRIEILSLDPSDEKNHENDRYIKLEAASSRPLHNGIADAEVYVKETDGCASPGCFACPAGFGLGV